MMMNNPNTEELLNSFIDGELSDRHRVEVQRLIAHDPQIAKRLRELENCRKLVSSLPRVEAPPYLFERIKAATERRTLVRVQPSAVERRRGARQLFARKLLAAAAMIALVGALGAVVYTIITPAHVPVRPVGPGNGFPTEPVVAVSNATNMLSPEFYGRLELRATNLAGVENSIKRAIKDNELTHCVSATSKLDKGIYNLSCSRHAVRLLLAELGDIWENIDSAILFVETEEFGRQVVVDAVTVEQIGEIIGADDLQKRVQVARDFAVLNSMTRLVPGRDVIVAIENTGPGLLMPPPRFTSVTPRKTAAKVEDKVNVHLTIALLGGK